MVAIKLELPKESFPRVEIGTFCVPLLAVTLILIISSKRVTE